MFAGGHCLLNTPPSFGSQILTHFFPMFPYGPSENIRKPKVFIFFQGDQKGTLGRNGLRNF